MLSLLFLYLVLFSWPLLVIVMNFYNLIVLNYA